MVAKAALWKSHLDNLDPEFFRPFARDWAVCRVRFSTAPCSLVELFSGQAYQDAAAREIEMEANKIVTAELVPGSKLIDHYESMGYTFAEFKTRFKDEAMAKADELRSEGFEAAYLVLKKGWYGCFVREAATKEKVETAAKADKPVVPVEIENFKFASTKEARAFARRLLDACRAAEDEAGL